MRTPSFPSPSVLIGASLALFTAGCTSPTTAPVAPPAAADRTAATAATAAPEPAARVTALPFQDLDYSGDQSALVALDRDLNAAGTDRKKLAAIEARLVALLRRTDGSIAARQAACQRLGVVLAATGTPSASVLDLLKVMLVDARESDIARLTLERTPGAAVDTLLADALGKTTGRTRLGLIQTLTARAPASAVPALAALLGDKDAATAKAAATALGQIGNAAALAALRTAPATVVGLFEAKLTAARKLPTTEGVALLTELLGDTNAAPHQRASALRGLLDLEPAGAAARLVAVLNGPDWTPKQAAVEAIASSRAPGLAAALAAQLPSWDVPTQAAVITAFSRRPDAAATSAIVAATQHTAASVRAAAINAVGDLPGDAALVTLLADLSSSDNLETAKLARASLARLNGPGVSATILARAEKGPAAKRALFIEQIALRNLTEGLPFLRQCRQDPDATLRTAAVGSLGDLAPVSEQGFILAWAVGAKDPAEQTRALRSLVTVTLNNPDTAKRALPIYAALEKAAPTTAAQLMPVLSRLGGKESAECAARLALSPDATIADAAAATLARWPDRTAQPSLVLVAAKATVASARATANQAAFRYYERNREVWTPGETSLVSDLLGATTDGPARKKLVVLLNRAADKPALALVEKLQSEPALAAAAKTAALCIAANLAGPPKARASDSEGSAKNLFDGKMTTQWRGPVTPGQWVEIDFKQSRPLHRLTLDQTGRTGEFPERYEVFVTDDLAKPGKVVVSGAGKANRTVIDLPAGTSGRYVTIKNTAERVDSMWSIAEFFVD